jgi:hypothetical protein
MEFFYTAFQNFLDRFILEKGNYSATINTADGTFVVAQQRIGERSETLAVSEVDITSSNRIHLRLEILDDTNESIPSYSIDGGLTFIEFSPQPLRIFTTGIQAFAFAQEGILAEVTCSDGIDNDGDGLVDLDDPDCL